MNKIRLQNNNSTKIFIIKEDYNDDKVVNKNF